jgi:hypothetical protein
MMIPRKSKSVVMVMVAIFTLFSLQNSRALPAEARPAPAAEPAESTCGEVVLRDSGEMQIPVPDICKDSLCRILVGTNASLGDFGPGYLMDIFYMQDTMDGSWIGGPNLTHKGISFSAGGGVNGDLNEEGVFIGGVTADGGSLSILDDSTFEHSSDTWTISDDWVGGPVTAF